MNHLDAIKLFGPLTELSVYFKLSFFLFWSKDENVIARLCLAFVSLWAWPEKNFKLSFIKEKIKIMRAKPGSNR